MPQIIKPTLSSELAKIYRAAIESQTTNAYFFLGKIRTWEDSDLGGAGVYDDATPPNPETSEAYDVETRNHIVSIQKTTITESSLAIRRNDWVYGTVYDMYDPRYSTANPGPSGADNLPESTMFVLTDEFNLYKCIYNNRETASTVKPTGTSTGYLQLSDGYIWKYMKTVPIIERNKFISGNYVPVSDIIAETFYDGAIGFNIVSGGSGYTNPIIIPSGDGTGAVLQPVVTSGSISNVVVVNGGTGYTQATLTVDSNGGGGSGAVIDAVIKEIQFENTQADVQLAAVDGEVSSVVINSTGSGYTTANATITGDGTGAVVTPVISGGAITSFTYSNRGSGYKNATITVSGDGTGFDGEVIIAPPNGHGFSLVTESFPNALASLVSGIDNPIQGKTFIGKYRQLGIIIDPVKYNVNDVEDYVEKITSTTATPCYLFQNGNIFASNYSTGDKLQDSNGNEYICINADNGSLLLQSLSDKEPVAGDSILSLDIPPVAVKIDSDGQLTPPNFDKTTGAILYIDNRIPFSKEADQIVNLRAFVEF